MATRSAEVAGNNTTARATVLRMEHHVRDFDEWKAIFDEKGPMLRQHFGARGYRVLREVSDPNQVMIDVTFDAPDRAEAFLGRMRELWALRVSEGVISNPQAHIALAVEAAGA